MYYCIARYKDTEKWQMVTNFFQQFAGEKGIMELLKEEMEKQYPNIEYKLMKVGD